MNFKHWVLGIGSFVVVVGIFSGLLYQFSPRDERGPDKLLETENTQSIDTSSPNLNQASPSTVEKEDEAVESEQSSTQTKTNPPSEASTVLPQTVVEEPEPQLTCKTQSQDNYTLNTSGNHAYGYYVPSTQSPSAFEWSVKVDKVPSKDSYWFFAFNFSMAGTFRPEQPNVGGYAGFQTNGDERLAIFSLWGAESSEGNGDFASAEIYEDGDVNRILGNYPWQVGKTYKFRLEKKSDSMVLYINGSKVGTHYIPSDYPNNFNSRISLFVEWFGYPSANFPVCVSFLDFSPTPSSVYPSTAAQENPLKFNIEALGDTLMFSR